MEVQVLHQIIKSGSRSFPIYIGFIKAEDLLKIAEVPNFSESTPHRDIAQNVYNPPVKQWQRPLIASKRDGIIETFNNTGAFMPNPVLVAEAGGTSPINIGNFEVGGLATPVRIINIPEPSQGQPKPLWIIDGQHRILGLGHSKCKQSKNHIPVVFLLNGPRAASPFYASSTLAEIFAQVTTKATPLSTLHNEWLSFAFKLGPSYEPPGSAHHKSMTCVAHLCMTQINSITGRPNGFHDEIKFNDELASNPSFLGHQYDCKVMSSIIARHYYDKTSPKGYLKPEDLAKQVSLAFDSLQQIVTSTMAKSVFFGSGRYSHKIMCNAYLVGVLAYLREVNKEPNDNDWKNLLKNLNFHQTDWDFQKHVHQGTGWDAKSGTLALDVFSEIFTLEKLPTGVSDIWNYLSGDEMFVELEFKNIDEAGNAVNTSSKKLKFLRGAKKTVPMAGRKYFRLSDRSTNAKHLEIIDEKSSPSDPTKFKISGEYLKMPKVDLSNPSQDPLELTIKCFLYGGQEEKITITLSGWK